MAASMTQSISLRSVAQRGCATPRRAGLARCPQPTPSRLRFAALRTAPCAAKARRPRQRLATCAAAGDGNGDKEPQRDEDGLYIGTYSNFFQDPAQLKGVVIFCGVLAGFFSLGNIGAALLLPVLYNRPIQWCVEAIVFGYPCK